MNNRTDWEAVKALTPMSDKAHAAYDDEERIAEFRALVHRLRSDAGLTQAELALRMGTTQSAIARMEGGGVRPTLETLEKLAKAIGLDLVVGVGEGLAEKAGIKTLVRSGHAVVRTAS
jgi:transcriptional regulator with XRE-family HTH domain